MATLTPEAKALLSSSIREPRVKPLKDIQDEAESRYRRSVPMAQSGLDEPHRKRRERLEASLDERARATKPRTRRNTRRRVSVFVMRR